MTNEVAVQSSSLDQMSANMEAVLIDGDLSKLTPKERVIYYNKVCESVGLNPLTRPFEYQRFNGKLQLYARKEATEQLRFIHQVSIYKMEKDTFDGVFVVTSYARTVSGKEDVSTGAVNVTGLRGEALANAFMKAETKSKRRVTLSVCGLGFLDETEVNTFPNSHSVKVNHETGDIIEDAKLEVKPVIPAPPFQELADDISNASSIDQLKNAYSRAYVIFKCDMEYPQLRELTALKDKRKSELEAMIDEFKQELADAEFKQHEVS